MRSHSWVGRAVIVNMRQCPRESNQPTNRWPPVYPKITPRQGFGRSGQARCVIQQCAAMAPRIQQLAQ